MRGVCIRLGQEGQGEGYALGLGRKDKVRGMH